MWGGFIMLDYMECSIEDFNAAIRETIKKFKEEK